MVIKVTNVSFLLMSSIKKITKDHKLNIKIDRYRKINVVIKATMFFYILVSILNFDDHIKKFNCLHFVGY